MESEKIDIIGAKFFKLGRNGRIDDTMTIKYFHLLISVFIESAYTFILFILFFTKNGGFYGVMES